MLELVRGGLMLRVELNSVDDLLSIMIEMLIILLMIETILLHHFLTYRPTFSHLLKNLPKASSQVVFSLQSPNQISLSVYNGWEGTPTPCQQ